MFRVRSAACAALALCVLLTLPVAPTRASGQLSACELALVPLDPTGLVRLLGVVVEAVVHCDMDACGLRSRQTYLFENPDRAGPTSFRVGLPANTVSGCPEPLAIALYDPKSVPVDRAAGSEAHASAWLLEVEPRTRASFTLLYDWPLSAEPLLAWGWQADLLEPWGPLEGIRVTFSLPEYSATGAFAQVSPSGYRFDGRQVTWDDADIRTAEPYGLILVAPPVEDRLDAARAASDLREMALLLVGIDRSAAWLGLSASGGASETLAVLQAAVIALPADPDLRLALADALRARAAAEPAMRLNYLLLAARELEAQRALVPDDADIAQALSRVYLDAARTASETGDPAGALTYLQFAESVAALAPALAEEIPALYLRWAYHLAREGRLSEALAIAGPQLTADMAGALYRYAPPYSSARAEVHVAPAWRTITYTLRPYAPMVIEATERLVERAHALAAVPGVEVALGEAGEDLVLTLRLEYDSVDELNRLQSELRERLYSPVDLLSDVLAAPLMSQMEIYVLQRGLLADRLIYREAVDLRRVRDAWEQEAQYAEWRTVELRAAGDHVAESETAAIERELALMALREQTSTWAQVPLGAHVTYRVEGPLEENPARPMLAWRVAWGEARTLRVAVPLWHWPRIIAIGLILLLSLGLAAGRTLTRRPAVAPYEGPYPWDDES